MFTEKEKRHMAILHYMGKIPVPPKFLEFRPVRGDYSVSEVYGEYINIGDILQKFDWLIQGLQEHPTKGEVNE